MNKQNYEVLCKIIAAVETGGQVYGQGRWSDVTKPYTNSNIEHTVTLGAYGLYTESQELVQAIFDADKDAFRKIDTNRNIEKALGKNWINTRYSPDATDRATISKLISTELGKQKQMEVFSKRLEKYIAKAEKFGVKSVAGQMMWAEIEHLGGNAVERIFKRATDVNEIGAILTSLKLDQNDTSSSNQVGDAKYWSRHTACADMIRKYATVEDVQPEKEEPKPSGYDINVLIAVARAELGYLEKKSNSNLDSKTANSGSNNFVRYWRDLYPSYQGQPWCDCFVSWVFEKAFGKAAADILLCGGLMSFYTPTSAQKFKDKKQWYSSPKVGDVIYFKNSTRIHHTGIVVAVDGSRVTTIEGNTSNGTAVVANGGGVFEKSYNWTTNGNIAGFGRPNYGNSPEPIKSNTNLVKFGQQCLNDAYGSKLDVDGAYGGQTKNSLVKALQTALNKSYKSGLEVDGVYGKMTTEAVKKHVQKIGMKNEVVGVLQIGLYLNGIDPNGFDKNFGGGCQSAVIKFQNSVGITPDGIAGNDTFSRL